MSQQSCQKKVWDQLVEWLTCKDKDEWLKDMKQSLSLAVSVIATITFQSALNPPGGVMQASDHGAIICKNSPCPGEAVLSSVKQGYYIGFLVCNTVCFIASASVCLLLMSGLPLEHRFPIWLLSIGMCITIIALMLTYFIGVALVTPHAVLSVAARNSAFGMTFLAFVLLLVVIGLLQVARFIIWGVQKAKNGK